MLLSEEACGAFDIWISMYEYIRYDDDGECCVSCFSPREGRSVYVEVYVLLVRRLAEVHSRKGIKRVVSS